MSHTKTPWVFGYSDGSGKYGKHRGTWSSHITVGDELLATVWDHEESEFDPDSIEMKAKANAEFIIRAVNNHEQLVRLLKIYAYPGGYEGRPSGEELQKEAREALKQAEVID